MGDNDYTGKFFGTEEATEDIPYLEHHIRDTPVGDRDKAQLKMRIETFQYKMVDDLADKINTSHNYIYYCAYSIGLMEFREHFIDDMRGCSEINSSIQDLVEESENPSENYDKYYSNLTNINIVDSNLRRNGLTAAKQPKVSTSEVAEVVKDYGGFMKTDDWIHRIVLAVGLAHRDSMRHHKKRHIQEYLDDGYELVRESINKFHSRVCSIARDVVYGEWGIENIPSRAYDNVIQLWTSVKYLNESNLEVMCGLNDGMEMP